MNQAAPSPMPEQPKKSNTWIYTVLGLVVVCCLCAVVVWAGYTFGDQIVKMLGITQ